MPITLSPIQNQLLACVHAYCKSTPVSDLIPKNHDTDSAHLQLYRLASEQKLVPMLYASGYCTFMRAELRQEIPRTARSHSLAQAIATLNFAELYRAFQTDGLEPIVVKGIISRSLYREEAIRPSGDEDILAIDDAFLRCHEKLLSLGGIIMNGNIDLKNASVISYMMPSGLHIELHRRLFDDSSEFDRRHNRFFETAATQHLLLGDIGGEVNIRAFAHTENIYYMILHALKHFICGGFGLRTALDIALYADRYFEHIDCAKLSKLLSEDSALDFTAAIFDICTARLGIDKRIFKLINGKRCCGDAMLLDMLSGGVYGTAEENRAHSATLTKTAASGKSKFSGIIKSMFPSADYMALKFPYVKCIPILLPIAWLHRGIRYIFGSDSAAGNSAGGALSIGIQRTELIKQYGIKTK